MVYFNFIKLSEYRFVNFYIRIFNGSFLSSLGYPAADREPRDENTKMRTRVAARAALFSSFSDDLRRLIGSETTRSGLLMIFEMLQVGKAPHKVGCAFSNVPKMFYLSRELTYTLFLFSAPSTQQKDRNCHIRGCSGTTIS